MSVIKNLSSQAFAMNLQRIFSHNKADDDGNTLCIAEESNEVMRKTDAKRHANKLVKTCSKAKLNITGMSCEHCVKAVTNAIIEAGGFDVTVSLEGGYAEFSVDSEKTVLQTVKAAIEDAGYDVE